MKNDDFLKKMENLQVPEVNPQSHPQLVKMAIMNAGRSAALGVWLVIVPCYFLFCVFMYYMFHGRTSWFGAMFTLASGLNKTPGIDFMAPIVLVVLPIVCIVINMLAIIHVQVRRYDGNARELNITIRPRLWNVLLILISIAIVFIFIAYVIALNITVRG